MRISKPNYSIRKKLRLEEICSGVCMTYVNWIYYIFIFQQLHVISTFVHSMAIALWGMIKRTVSVSRAVRPTSSLSVEQTTPPTGICVSSRRPAVRRDDESTRRTLGSASNLVSMWGPVSREVFFTGLKLKKNLASQGFGVHSTPHEPLADLVTKTTVLVSIRDNSDMYVVGRLWISRNWKDQPSLSWAASLNNCIGLPIIFPVYFRYNVVLGICKGIKFGLK